MTRLQLEITLGVILVLITSIVLVVYGLDEQERMARFEVGHAAQAIEEGAALYETNCSGCHGLKGEGVPGLCPPLNDRHFFTDRLAEVNWSGSLEDYIVSTISSGRLQSTRPELYAGNGLPAMPAWSEHFGGPLREDQIRYIADFVMNWEATALGQADLEDIPTPALDDPVARGQAVFNSNGCGGCHAIQGLSAGTVGPELTQIGTVAETRVEGMSAEEYLHESIVNPSAHIVEGYNDLMPKNFGDILSEEQLADLIAFLSSLK
jgi:cbb3-type cytochrome c oxidase subunit III